MHAAHQLTTDQGLAEAGLTRNENAPVRARRAPRNGQGQTRPGGRAKSHNLEHYLSRAFLQVGPVVFALAVVSVLSLAWIWREEGYLSADSGVGYWFGIAGASIMTLLMLYPLRKRYKFLNWTGRIAGWFRVHMVLGILGPMLVILHTNYKLGSLNSRLALFTMLTVVASGIIGRYIYSKVHKGLYGAHTEMRDIYADLAVLKSTLGSELGHDEGLERELERYLPKDMATGSIARGLVSALTARARTSRSRRLIMGTVKAHLKTSPHFAHWNRRQKRAHARGVEGHLRIFFAAAKKAERLALFDRLLGLWHHLHLPLFTLLVLTVVIHIIAVHRY